jgi:DnaJ like chaperone protein
MWTIILIILAVLYILNPFDLLPDLIIGWGWLDDAVILGFLIRYFYNRKKKRQTSQQHYQNRKYNHRRANGGAANNKSRGHSRTGASASTHWDPYRILELEKGASQTEIKHAFRQLAGKYHPDKVEYLGDEFKALAEKRFKDIQQAYEELKMK